MDVPTSDSRGTVPGSDAEGASSLKTQELIAEVFDELRSLAAARMRAERREHTLRPTEIVHEAYLRLAQQHRTLWQNRAHFMAVASTMVRRVLVDHARARAAVKRGGASRRLSLDVDPALTERAVSAEGRSKPPALDLLELDEALTDLAALDGRQARIVELRFFGGLDVPETAQVLGVSERTVKADWRIAKAWLHMRLAE